MPLPVGNTWRKKSSKTEINVIWIYIILPFLDTENRIKAVYFTLKRNTEVFQALFLQPGTHKQTGFSLINVSISKISTVISIKVKTRKFC